MSLDRFGRTICRLDKCPAYYKYDGNDECDALMRLYPSKWDYENKKYIPLCKISSNYKLIDNNPEE